MNGKSGRRGSPILIVGKVAVPIILAVLVTSGGWAGTSGRLFPAGLPHRQWVEFKAEGYKTPVWGTIYGGDNLPVCGMPLGGIGTGCLDVEANGKLGYCTIFSRVWGFGDGDDGSTKYRDRIVGSNGQRVNLNDPSRGKMNVPYMSIEVGKNVWVLTTSRQVDPSTKNAKRIDYWGHYPVVDMEYTLDAPVGVAVRAWSPLVPGDVIRSNTPGAFFEVHLRNLTSKPQSGSFVMSFPGPRKREIAGQDFARETIWDKDFSGLYIATASKIGYAIVALDGIKTQTPASEPGASIGKQDGSGALSVEFKLEPRQSKVVRFVLTWYSPVWRSHWPEVGKADSYTNMYTTRFTDARHVAEYLAKNRESLWEKVVAWQQVIYSDKSTPGWLRDGLINIMHLLTEESYWSTGDGLVAWSGKDGVFSLVEGTDAGGQQSCIPCDWYGNLPLVYFFPELARNTLRAYVHGQRDDGAVPMTLGVRLDISGQYQYDYQRSLNPCCFVDLVDRLWMRTGDDAVLKEFYPAVKKTTEYLINNNPGAQGFISIQGQEWYEAFAMPGMSSHAGGVRLAHIKMAERMARKMGDARFAEQCRQLFEQASGVLENKLWAGTHYLIYSDPTSDKKSDLILSHQLDGEWMADFHGVPGVFRSDRVRTALATIKAKAEPPTECGLLTVVGSDGKVTNWGGRMGGMCTMPASVFITAMSYFYEGDDKCGMEITYNCLNNLVNTQGMTWDMPNMCRGDRGDRAKMRRIYGFDYYQCMSLWGMPAAIDHQDIKASCKPGSLVDKMIKAATMPSGF